MPSTPTAARSRTDSALMGDHAIRILGWVGTATAMTMFFSSIDQIRLDLGGRKGSLLIPFVTVGNRALWTTYGALRKDYPIMLGNFPGVVLGLAVFLTGL